MRRIVSMALAAGLLVGGCGGGLSDAELAWCADNYGAVVSAGGTLGVHVRSAFDEYVDHQSPGETISPDIGLGSMMEPSTDWAADAGSVRACKAAFAGR